MTRLSELDLSFNRIKDELLMILQPLESIQSLQSVRLAGNHISGILSTRSFWTQNVNLWPVLSTLDLSNNGIEGNMFSLRNLPSNVAIFGISNNKMSGMVDVSNSGELRQILLDGNRLHSQFKEQPLGSTATVPYKLDDSGKFSCPTLTGIHHDIEISLEPSYYDYSLCKCSIGYYGTNGNCIKCPPGGECLGTQLIITAGWAPSPSIENMMGLVPCKVDTSGNSPCNPDNKPAWECRPGHYGRLCSRCKSNFFLLDSFCSSCPIGVPFLALALLVIGLIAVFTFRLLQSEMSSPDLTVRLRILLNYFQMLQLTSTLKRVFSVPGNLTRFVSITSSFSFKLEIFACANMDLADVRLSLFALLVFLPLMVLGGLSIVLVSALIYRTATHVMKSSQAVITALLTFMQFVYLPITAHIAQTFDCIADPYDGHKYLATVPWFECAGMEYNRVLGAAVFGLIIYVIGIPILFAWGILFVKRHSPNVLESGTSAYKATGSSYKPLRALPQLDNAQRSLWLTHAFSVLVLPYTQPWFGLLITIRSALLGVLANVLGTDRSVTPLVVFGVLIASLTTILMISPYRRQRHNHLEAASVIVVAFTLCGGGIKGGTKESDDGIDWVIFVVNVLFVTAFVLYILHGVVEALRQTLSSVVVPYLRGAARTYTVEPHGSAQREKKEPPTAEVSHHDDGPTTRAMPVLDTTDSVGLPGLYGIPRTPLFVPFSREPEVLMSDADDTTGSAMEADMVPTNILPSSA